MREVLGMLDKWASKFEHENPERGRFIFASLPAILKVCAKGKRVEGKSYTLRNLKLVMAELRARHIVSPYFETWDGRYGFIMEPHAFRARLIDDSKVCEMRAPIHFECSDEVAEMLTGISPQISPYPSPRLHHDFTSDFTTTSPATSPTGSRKFTGDFTDPFTIELLKVYKNAELTEALCESWFPDGKQVGAPIRCSRSAVVSGLPELSGLAGLSAKQDQPQRQEQKQDPPQSQKQEQAEKRTEDFSSLRPTDSGTRATATPAPKMTDKTIEQHFAPVSYEKLSDGRITDEDMENFDEPDLRQCMRDAVAERAEQPYCGLLTNAALMGIVMSLMKQRHKKNCPPMWLPVMKAMRAQPVRVEGEMSGQQLAMKAFGIVSNLIPGDFHIKNGFERCEDEIWRPQADREERGFTVKGEYQAAGKTYNVWRKPHA